MTRWAMAVVLVAVAASAADAQERGRPPFGRFRGQDRPRSEMLTIEQQRKLGLSDEQIQKIADARGVLERERAKLEEQLRAADDAVAQANVIAWRLRGQIRDLTTVRIRKVYESVMTPEQLAAWKKQGTIEEARRYLRQYTRWLSLKDDQVEDLALMLVPVFEKYDKLEADETQAREALAKLRRAEKVDVAAVEAAEKKAAEADRLNSTAARYRELREAMRAGLMPDQLERLERGQRRR